MRFYAGSYTRMGGPGIAVCHWDGSTLSQVGTYRDLEDTIYIIISKDRRTLYAVGSFAGTGEGAVVSYRMSGDRLELLSCRKTGGRATCHLTESPDGRYLYVSNYLSGSVSVLPIQNGELNEPVQLVEHTGQGPIAARQEAAHPHQCVFRPGMNELFVCDLGTDRVVIYQQNPETGILTRQRELVMPDGMGPRHLVFSDSNHFYVTGELDNIVRLIAWKNDWHIIGEISTLPEKCENTSAAIRLHDGALWVSNRGHDSLCRITLDEHGGMNGASWIMTGGQCPRDFTFVPGGLLRTRMPVGL